MERIQLDDLKDIQTPEDVAALFTKIGYLASAQAIDVEALELPARSAEAVVEAYLLASHEQGGQVFQVLLFQLQPEEFASYSLRRNRMRMIANSLCRRAANYLLVATDSYRQLLLASSKRAFDEQLNLITKVEFYQLDLAHASYQERNWLEKLSPQALTPEAVLQSHQNTLKTASNIQKEQAEKFSDDSVRLYLREIGRVPLLSASEEIELSRKVRKFKELKQVRDRLKKQLQREPTNREWAGATSIPLLSYQVGLKARNKLIEANLRLVVSIAKKYQGRGLELLDLIQAGNLGLMQGVNKFDPELGYKFSTYAYQWIRQGITRAIAFQSRLIRLPVHLYEKMSTVKKETRSLSQELKRKPSEVEVANRIEIDVQKLRGMLKLLQTPRSLDLQIGDEEDSPLIDFIRSDDDPIAAIERELLQQNVEAVLVKVLKPREVEVLKQRFGFGTDEPKSLAEIGRDLNLSRERVRQIESKALEKLRWSKQLRDIADCVSPKAKQSSQQQPVQLGQVVEVYPAQTHSTAS